MSGLEGVTDELWHGLLPLSEACGAGRQRQPCKCQTKGRHHTPEQTAQHTMALRRLARCNAQTQLLTTADYRAGAGQGVTDDGTTGARTGRQLP